PYEGLDGLSGKKEEWCFQRKKDHTPSGTYEPFAINKYDAYYLNPNVKEGDKVIYFSFDCGYENGYTPKILDTLKKHGVKATFFVTQQFLDSDADLAKRMKEEGHLVGNHTVHHPSLPEKSAEEVVKEVRGVEESFKEKTGYELDKFIRPPMGHYSEKVLKELQNMGYITIFWSIAYGDYDLDNQPGKQYVVDHFRQYHHNGAITLTHTISESNTKALDQVLTDLEAEGYRFGSLEELRN
ncbi:MAG: polysaccharide deacetylase family protein, partial [Lachnospiraceae bacterium]|nr:polysaccharide deacetylase family protein [Lachnospiraceae bacterium]